jgi:hypothetical protein
MKRGIQPVDLVDLGASSIQAKGLHGADWEDVDCLRRDPSGCPVLLDLGEVSVQTKGLHGTRCRGCGLRFLSQF